jgi:cell division protein FtsN
MQGELFHVSPFVTEAAKVLKTETPNLPDRFQVTLRIDHLMIGGIFALVLYVLIFSFGVERGKRYAKAEIREANTTPGVLETSKEVGPIQTESPVISAVSDLPSQEPSLQPATEIGSAPPTGEYTIQIVAYKTRKQAEATVERLKITGVQGFIVPQGKFFFVCADAFSTMKEAKARLAHFKAEGHAPPDAYIRPLNAAV